MNKLLKVFSTLAVLFTVIVTLVACGSTSYKVTFDVDGQKQTIETTGKISGVEIPKKEGYRFLGWFLGDKQVDLKQVVTSDLELVAKFEKVTTENPGTDDSGSTNNGGGTTTGENEDDTIEKEEPADKTDRIKLEELVKKVEAKMQEADYSTKYANTLRENLSDELELSKEVLATENPTKEELETRFIQLEIAFNDLINNNPSEDDDDTTGGSNNGGSTGNADDNGNTGGGSEGGNSGSEDGETPAPTPQPEEVEEVEVTLHEKQEDKVSVTLKYPNIIGFKKLTEKQNEELKEEYLTFFTLNGNPLNADNFIYEMLRSSFKLTITGLNLNDKLVIKKGLAYTGQKDGVVKKAAKSNADLNLVFNGVNFVLDEGQTFDKISATNISVEPISVIISSTQNATVTVTFLPENSTGVIETELSSQDHEVTVNVQDNVVTISTTKQTEIEIQLDLTIKLKDTEVTKVVRVTIAKDANNASTSESNIIADLKLKEITGKASKYQDGTATFTNSKNEETEITGTYVNGKKDKDKTTNEENLSLVGYHEGSQEEGSLTLDLNTTDKVKKLIFKLTSNHTSDLNGITLEITKNDDSKITKELTNEQILSQLTEVVLEDSEVTEIKTLKLTVKKSSKANQTNNKPKVTIHQITVYKLNS